MSVWTINTYGRRILLLWGHGLMTFIHLLVGIFIITDNDYGVLAGILLFLFVYQNSSGPIAYAYATETCCDAALGMCILTLYLTVLVLSLSTEPMMDSALQPQGVFFLFAILSLCAFFFLYFYLGETRGLTNEQKKSLYCPGAPWGRKLKEGEIPNTPLPSFSTSRRDIQYLNLNQTEDTRATNTNVPSFLSVSAE